MQDLRLGWLVNTELERVWQEALLAYLRHYPGICLGGDKTAIKPYLEYLVSGSKFELEICEIRGKIVNHSAAMFGHDKAVFLRHTHDISLNFCRSTNVIRILN
jgi:hypothetical protein